MSTSTSTSSSTSTSTSPLADLSDALAAAVASTAPSLVRVEARRRMPASGLVWSADGIVVTAHHVVRRDDSIAVGLDGDSVPATLVGRDPSTDIAVLRVEGGLPGAAATAWDDGDAPAVGQMALAVGRPGRSPQAALGLVSAVGGAWRTGAGGAIDRWLRADVVMYPGFSGGALVSARGTALGMLTSGLARDAALAVPPATLRRVVADILAHGSVRRARLGVGVQPVRLPAALAATLGQETGVLIVSVEDDSAAARAGLHLGDTLTALDGQPLRDLDDLMDALSGDRIGREVSASIVRGGAVETVLVTLDVAA